ncbi:glycosyltransferase family 2 [Apiospora kogelbergensis]|uniref:glycosyltransferase family 2 n=1 Tax=Apiospora kogelbergensis TaxID=1337665 RepID=UPI00313092C5
MSLPAAKAILAGLYLFDFYDRRAEARHQQTYRPFPVPPADRRRFHPADVSLVVPTVDTDFVVFAACLASWSRCAPGEIIVVATEAQAARVAEPNKRHQLIKGIQASRGKILALVDDDAKWESAETLTSLLAPFEVDDIGLVGGPVEQSTNPDIPFAAPTSPERRDPAVVTPWEVAALRLRANRHTRMRAAHAADGGINFSVSGATVLARARLLRDDALFQFEFANERWAGRRQNAGDDAFLTRWVLFHHLADDLPARRRRMVAQLRKDATAAAGTLLGGRYEDDAVFEQLANVTELDTRRWRLGVQMTEQATVPTCLKQGSEFAGQMKRWTRSGA